MNGQYFTVAWFKLADFVVRGEKERALGVHKLLMHSVEDKALSYQLEADILLSFDDDEAVNKYHIAANLYKKSGRFTQAVCVYEHVSAFKSDPFILESLLDVYLKLEKYTQAYDVFERCAQLYIDQGNLGIIINKLHALSLEMNQIVKAHLYARAAIILARQESMRSQVLAYVQQALFLLHEAKASHKEIQDFLLRLQTIDESMHAQAVQYHYDVLLEQ